MIWEVDEQLRGEFWALAGLNMCGARKVVRFFPSGRVGDFEPEDLRSCILAAPVGARYVLMANPGPDWMAGAWRCIRMLPGKGEASAEGLRTIHIPDLDTLDEPDAHRTDPDFQESWVSVDDIAKGKGWTFGHRAGGPLKGRIRGIRLEWEPKP